MKLAHSPWIASVVLLATALGASSQTVTEYIDTFNSAAFVPGAVGPIPSGWQYPGYGAPSFTAAETGQTTAPMDGLNQAALFALPLDLITAQCGGTKAYPCLGTGTDCYCGDGMLLKHVTGGGLELLVSRQIDWTYPVTLTVDVQAFDPSVGGVWNTILDVWWYDSVVSAVEWGDNGHANGEWTTASVELAAGQGSPHDQFAILLITHFEVAPTDVGEARTIFDSLRITYTPVPEFEVCNNGIDDDVDGATDCEDSDCLGDANCPCNPVIAFDVDLDGDVDQDDFGVFQECYTGSANTGGLSTLCACMDLTGPALVPDGSIDQQDFVAFQDCASAPGVEALESCDD